MTDALQACLHLLQRLKDQGIDAVFVGGCARDTYLGITPKDYDLVILTPGLLQAEVEHAIEQATNRIAVPMQREAISGYECQHESRGLTGVLEFELGMDCTHRDLPVQVLLFDDQHLVRWDGDPYNVVVEHDCSLNHAWLEVVNNRLVPRVGTEFPSPHTGNFNNFRTGWSNPTRMAYVMQKFPEFNHR